MTTEEKLTTLQAMTGETDSSVLSAFLALAGSKILRKRYPYGTDETQVPEQYEFIQLEIAAYLLNKRGAEGETAHSENGIARSYENGDVPPSMLRAVVPMAEVL